MSDKEKKRGKSSGLGLAIWILAFVIVIIVFLVKWDDIKSNLVKTRFFERLFGKTPSFLVDKNSEDKKDDDSQNVIELAKSDDKKSDDKKSEKITKKDEPQKSKQETKSEENQKAEKKSETKKTEQKIPENLEKKSDSDEKKSQSKSAEKKSESQRKTDSSDASKQIKTVQESKIDTTAKKSTEKSSSKKNESKSETKSEKKSETNAGKTVSAPATVAAKICFVAIDSDGTVIRKEVNRQVAKDSPLTESLNSLLSGPTALESKTGCQTLIPAGTKLYSAVVKNGTATLDFSEEFRFNPKGVEGYLGQFMQVVYTATNFSTVQNVQILIEGKKIDFLDDLPYFRIGVPLSRASFR